MVSPLVVGALVEDLGFTGPQGGNTIFAEFVGAAFATFPAFWWLSNMNWRKVLYIALAITVLGNLCSAVVGTPGILGLMRFITGVGVGTIMLVTLTTAGLTANQERVFGFWQTGQIVFAALALAIMPYVIPEFGVRVYYIALAIFMASMALVVKNFPTHGNAQPGFRWSELETHVKKLAPLAFCGLIFFFIAVGGVWTYIERIANIAGLDYQFIGTALAGISIIGVLGALSATWLSTKLGRMIPFIAGMLLIAISFFLLYGLSSATVFIVAAFLFKFAWWFVGPYLLANMTALDPSGRLITATNFAIAFGQGLGPLVVGLMLVKEANGDVLDYSPTLTIGLIALLICVLLLVPVVRATNKLLNK